MMKPFSYAAPDVLLLKTGVILIIRLFTFIHFKEFQREILESPKDTNILFHFFLESDSGENF